MLIAGCFALPVELRCRGSVQRAVQLANENVDAPKHPECALLAMLLRFHQPSLVDTKLLSGVRHCRRQLSVGMGIKSTGHAWVWFCSAAQRHVRH